MASRPRHELTQAEARYRALVDELKLLTMSFPHLRDMVDQDELPVSFLIRRGADRARAAGTRSKARSVPPKSRPRARRTTRKK